MFLFLMIEAQMVMDETVHNFVDRAGPILFHLGSTRQGVVLTHGQLYCIGDHFRHFHDDTQSSVL